MLGALLPRPLRPAVFRLEERFPPLAARRLFKPFPYVFQVETTSWCNADCVICPYPDTAKEIAMGQMDEALWRKIVDECAGREVHTFEPFFNNEPLLDRRLPARMDYARERLPAARIQLDTNLSLLSDDAAASIVRNVDILLVSAHGITPEEYRAVMPKLAFARFLENLDRLLALPDRERVRITVNCVNVAGRPEAEIRAFWARRGLDVAVSPYVDRAGNVREEAVAPVGRHGLEDGTGRAGPDGARPTLGGCWNTDIPLMKMNIAFNGDVVLCCMDWRRNEVLGNVRGQSIAEVWNSAAFWRVRDALYGGGPVHDDFLCHRCKNPHPGGRHAKFW